MTNRPRMCNVYGCEYMATQRVYFSADPNDYHEVCEGCANALQFVWKSRPVSDSPSYAQITVKLFRPNYRGAN